MGLKVRLGLALSGLFLSSMFGVNMLTGIKDYVDTTGNIMVDIADGIGILSKGIEYLEFYLDPDADSSSPNADSLSVPPGPEGVPLPSTHPPPSPSSAIKGTPDNNEAVTSEQPTVICQKGKCYPFDPNKMKNSNINLEAKPGIILTPQASSKRNPDENAHESEKRKKDKKVRSQTTLAADVLPSRNISSQQQTSTVASSSSSSSTTSTQISSPTPTSSTVSTPSSSSPPSSSASASSSSTSSEDKVVGKDPNVSGTRRVLTALRSLLNNTSKLLVRLVSRLFPWNRRAKRRLQGEDEDL